MPYDRRLVGWLSLGQLITWGSVFYTFALLMEPVERDLGLTPCAVVAGLQPRAAGRRRMAWPVGRWIDRGHERAVMTGGSLLIAAGLLLHSFVQSAAGFYAVWIVLGAALSATLYTPAFAIVTRRFPNDFRRAIITLTFLGGLASTVFIPLDRMADRATRLAACAVGAGGASTSVVCVPLHCAGACAMRRPQRVASGAGDRACRPAPSRTTCAARPSCSSACSRCC